MEQSVKNFRAFTVPTRYVFVDLNTYIFMIPLRFCGFKYKYFYDTPSYKELCYSSVLRGIYFLPFRQRLEDEKREIEREKERERERERDLAMYRERQRALERESEKQRERDRSAHREREERRDSTDKPRSDSSTNKSEESLCKFVLIVLSK